MDTKLKSNKGICLLVACIITALFAGGFMALYPVFESKAAKYYKDGLSSGSFLVNLYKSNYVFYKEIVEKANETIYSYDQLYLDIQEETASEVQTAEGEAAGMPEETLGNVYMLLDEMRVQMANTLNEWESEVADQISRQMDYCVIDRGTGELVKNTGKHIEALAGGDDSEKQGLPYVYYVMVTYDNAGNPDHVAVKGRNSDELLKNVQAVMGSRDFISQFNSMYEDGYYVQQKHFYGYSNLEGKWKIVDCSIQSPKNVTFIYAMTQEQKEAMIRDSMLYASWDEWYAYFQAGAYDVYLVFLGMLAVIGLLLMLNKKYSLHHTRAVRIPLEAAVFLVVMIAGAFPDVVVNLVRYTSQGYFDSVWNKYLFFLPLESYPVLTEAVNFAALFLLFGGWFYAVHMVGELPALGIGGFLKERSICVRAVARFGRWLRKLWRNFQEELLHVDLGEDVGHTLHKVLLVNFILLGLICSIWFFGWFALIIYSVVLYFLLKKYIKKLQDQYGKLLEATGSIAEGNLNTAFDEDFGVFESYKEELYKIQEGFRKAVDEEVKSQRMKAELITNVSHDLKTPLTAITTYIDLLKEEGVTEEQRKEYLAVLEKKSLRLKRLIEDLFEVSKASSRNVTVNLVEVDICNLVRQAYLEYEDKIEEANLVFRFRMPEEKVVLKLDSEKTYRIFENLYSNIIKYAMPGSRVYVDLEEQEGKVVVGLRNMSAVELHVRPEELTERFVRGDSSRNTEGSGLGLAIAKSFAEVQGGKMEIVVDGDLFKIVLTWNK